MGNIRELYSYGGGSIIYTDYVWYIGTSIVYTHHDKSSPPLIRENILSTRGLTNLIACDVHICVVHV